MYKLNATTRLVADEALAPAESFRSENQEGLHERQSEREHGDDKSDYSDHEVSSNAEDASPTDHFTSTEIDDNVSASSTIDGQGPDLPQTQGDFACMANTRLLADRLNTENDPLTQDMENAGAACSLTKATSRVDAADTSDGIVPNSEVGFPEVKDEGEEDELDVEGCDILADADPKIFNVAQQPLG